MRDPYLSSEIHSEELQEIVSKPPAWLLNWGITFILIIVLILLGTSVFIQYPELVKTPVKFNTEDSPKIVSAKISGNLMELLAKDGAIVKSGDYLAYLESTADHGQVIMLMDQLNRLRKNDEKIYNLENLIAPKELNLGELQDSYQIFYTAYLNYISSGTDGIYQKRRSVIYKELSNVKKQYIKSNQSFDFQKKQLDLAEKEFERYKILAEKKIISPSELQEREILLLSKRQSIPQTEDNLISYQGNILSKNKELNDIENQISEEKKKFFQSLNSFLVDAENWKRKYVLVSPISGKLIYGDFLQVNQTIREGQKLFYINTNNEKYYGELMLPQSAFAKVKNGQKVLVKVRSYPYEEFGYLNGNISYISDILIGDSVLFAKLSIVRKPDDSLIRLKPGIMGDAEIVTEDKSAFKRIWDNLTKKLKFEK
ncbi:HlyD family secretion protein [Sphingobacterium siyangense]|uniref:HlyD family secretion protein n=1 Tax=Sphingobacterium siyangense TaxID=459529 RepID=UPI003C7894F1